MNSAIETLKKEISALKEQIKHWKTPGNFSLSQVKLHELRILEHERSIEILNNPNNRTKEDESFIDHFQETLKAP